MHFVPSYKMKNQSSKRPAVREGALKSFEPSILYWNSFYSILDSWSTIWASIQTSLVTLWRYLPHWRTILVRFLFTELKSVSCNIKQYPPTGILHIKSLHFFFFFYICPSNTWEASCLLFSRLSIPVFFNYSSFNMVSKAFARLSAYFWMHSSSSVSFRTGIIFWLNNNLDSASFMTHGWI